MHLRTTIGNSFGKDKEPAADCVVRLQVRVGDLVSGVLDVAGASPRRFFFEVLMHFATDPVEADRLAYFGSPDGREALAQYNQREGEELSRQCLFIHVYL